MSNGNSVPSQVRIALMLVVIHTLLMAIAVAIGLGGLWDDDNPTYLYYGFLYWVDFPLNFVLGRGFDAGPSNSHFVLLTAMGAVYWFIVGVILQTLRRAALKGSAEKGA